MPDGTDPQVIAEESDHLATATRPADAPLGDNTDTTSATPSRPSRMVIVGVAGAVVTFLGLALVWMLAVPLFVPADEAAHVDYISQVGHGTLLPVAGQVFTAEFPELGQRSGLQHVANHPPLYPLIVSPLVIGAEHSHSPRAWLLATRGIGVLLTAFTIVLIAVLARSVTARASRQLRDQLTVLAAGLAATLPSLLAAVGSIQNDALVVMLTTGTLVLLARLLRRGPSPRLLLAISVACVLGMLTRATFAQVFMVAVATVVVLRLWPGLAEFTRPDRERIVRAIGAGLLVTAVTVVGAGWFYLVNKHRYGDLIGENGVHAVAAHRGPIPGASHGMFAYLFWPKGWWIQIEQLGGISAARVNDPGGLAITIGIILSVMFGIGALSLASRWRSWRTLDPAGWLLLAGCLVIFLISFVEIANHVTHRGSPNNRYLLEGLPLWGIGVGAVFLAASPRRFPFAAIAALCAEVVASIAFIVIITRRQTALVKGKDGFDTLATSMDHVGVPASSAVLGVLLAAIACGVVLLGVALLRLGRDDSAVARVG